MNSYKSGENFIDHIYQELINTEEVKKAIQRRSINPKNREEAVRFYMERMQHAHNTQRKIDILKRFYYKKYVIDHMPESYVERQWRIAREQGYGDIRVTDEMKRKMLEEIQSEQRKSIDRWLDYLNSADAMYPMWFKYYAFQGMIKLGHFDKEKKKFGKRTKDTTNPFIEVNPEILGQMYTILSKMIEKQELTEEETKTLEKGESFQKLYTSLLIQMEENRIVNGIGVEGKWIKYEQGDNYQELWKSLQGKNTGWCTAGEMTCKEQIEDGDFYVYYTYDKDGNPTEPRIAIRMDGTDEIAEVRGIGRDQNLEPEMVQIVETKLKDFPNNEGEIYQKKVHDMRLLTEIERKTNSNEELTQEEIIFLYELGTDIDGFGWEKDPRIEEIINQRDSKEDIRKLDIETIINGVSYNGHALKYIPTDIPNYEQIILAAINRNSDALVYVPENLITEEIAMESVKKDGNNLEFVPEKLKTEEIVLAALKKNGQALRYVTEEFQFKTPEIAFEAVKYNGYALKYVPKELITEEMAVEAIKEFVGALYYVPKDLPNYEEIALKEVKKNVKAINYIPADIQNHEQILQEALSHGSFVLRDVTTVSPYYKELAVTTIEEYPEAVEDLPFWFSENITEEIILELLKDDYYYLIKNYIPEDFEFENPEIALEAVKQRSEALIFISTDLPNYEEIILEAAKRYVTTLCYVPTDLPNYKQIAMEAVKYFGSALRFVPKDLITKEMALEAIKQNPNALKYVPEDTPGYYELYLLDYLSENNDEKATIKKVK